MTGTGPSAHGLRGEYGLPHLIQTLYAHRRITLGVPFALALVAAVVTLVMPVTYTASVTFVPEATSQSRLPSNLAGLASQFGVSLGGEASKSPRFYAEVLRSRELNERVLLDRYPDPRAGGADSATLLSLLGVGGRDSAARVARGVRKLRGLVVVRPSNATNIVELNVDSRYPVVAAAVANRFISYLNAFNAQYRKSQAREQRTFVEQRLSDGERELRTAEEGLRTFYERNRSWRDSPQLTFEEGRLRRQVDVHQELYLTLKREYEMARIQEVNDTPVITVIDAATPPVRRSKPRRSLVVVLVGILATMLCAVWVTGADYLRWVRAQG